MTARLTYEDIAALVMESTGIEDCYDILEAGKHYDAWRTRKGMPEAIAVKDQQEQYQVYLTDPDGNAARPAYLNLWHWFLGASGWDSKSNHGRQAVQFDLTPELADKDEWASMVLANVFKRLGNKIPMIIEPARG